MKIQLPSRIKCPENHQASNNSSNNINLENHNPILMFLLHHHLHQLLKHHLLLHHLELVHLPLDLLVILEVLVVVPNNKFRNHNQPNQKI